MKHRSKKANQKRPKSMEPHNTNNSHRFFVVKHSQPEIFSAVHMKNDFGSRSFQYHEALHVACLQREPCTFSTQRWKLEILITAIAASTYCFHRLTAKLFTNRWRTKRKREKKKKKRETFSELFVARRSPRLSRSSLPVISSPIWSPTIFNSQSRHPIGFQLIPFLCHKLKVILGKKNLILEMISILFFLFIIFVVQILLLYFLIKIYFSYFVN